MNDVIIWTNMKTTERLPYLDYARIFAAYLVILGHLLPTTDTNVRIYIYSFHMPFFFLVSGMLHKDSGCIAWHKYWKTLVVPLLFFNLLFFILRPLFCRIGLWGGDSDDLLAVYMFNAKQSFINVFEGKNLPDIPTWFLIALLWCKVLTDCISRHRWLAVIFLCSLAGVLLVVFHSRTYLRIGNALMVMPFFYGGYRFKKEIYEWCRKRGVLLLGIGMFLFNIPLAKLNGRVSTDNVWFGEMFAPFNVVIFYFNAFTTSIGLLIICMQFPAKRLVTISAKALITILCVQAFFCSTYWHVCAFTNYLLAVATSVLIFIACVLIHQLFERYLPFVVGK